MPTRKQKAGGALGSLLAGAGTGAGIGSFGGPIGTAVGGALGAGTGLGSYLLSQPLSNEALAKRQKELKKLQSQKNLTPVKQQRVKELQKTLGITNSQQGQSDQVATQGNNQLPPDVHQIQRYTPQQLQILNGLANNSYNQLQQPGKYNFNDIRNEEIRKFNQETSPLIATRFAGLQEYNSGAYNRAMAQAQQDAASKLAALGVDYQNKEREKLMEQLKLGLGQQYDLLHAPQGPGFGEQFLRNAISPQVLGQGLGLARDIYNNYGQNAGNQQEILDATNQNNPAFNASSYLNMVQNQATQGTAPQYGISAAQILNNPQNLINNGSQYRTNATISNVLQGNMPQYGIDALQALNQPQNIINNTPSYGRKAFNGYYGTLVP